MSVSATNATSAQTKEKDVEQIVRYLCHMFNKTTEKLERAQRTKNGPNLAYRLQSEFAHRLNELVQGPKCMMQKHITDCNEYIDEVMQLLAR